MSRLTDIPVRIEPSRPTQPPSGGLGGGVAAILSELATLLERLVRGEPSRSIDLRSLPMSPQDRAELQRVLGEGEVQATIDARGLSKIRETRISGVWWVEHFDERGELIAELIAVSRIPEILACVTDEMAAGARNLRALIGVSGASLREGRHGSQP
jgi:hypothetical protein